MKERIKELIGEKNIKAIGYLKGLYFNNNNGIPEKYSRFTKDNLSFWKGYDCQETKGYILVENMRGGAFWPAGISIIAQLIAYHCNARIMYISPGSVENDANWLRKSFGGNCEFVSRNELVRKEESEIEDHVIRLISGINEPKDVLDLKFDNVWIGELVYDAVLKYINASLWEINDKVKVEIKNAIKSIYAYRKLNQTYLILGGYVTHTTGTLQGIYSRLLIKDKKPLYQGIAGYGGIHLHTELLEKDRIRHLWSIPNSIFLDLYRTKKNELLPVAKDYMEIRLGGGINDFDASRAFSADKNIFNNKEDFCKYYGLDPKKPCVFVMLHAMTDDPHVNRQHIFKDYYDWFAHTLKIAKTVNNVNWVFKQHPTIKFYPDDANLKGIFEFIDNENIIYLDEHEPFNSASLRFIAHAIVTCAGTAGLEFLGFGVPAVLGCRNHYSEYDICYTASDYDDYKKLLNNIENIETVTVEAKEKAFILFYLMYGIMRAGMVRDILSSKSVEEIWNSTFDEVVNDLLSNYKREECKESIDLFMEFLRSNENFYLPSSILLSEGKVEAQKL